jgi:citrate lyase subunit beta / citryl-CoA lyase
MRSLLFVPGDQPRKLEKARGCGADALIVDLEDSVAAGAKTQARHMAGAFLQAADRTRGPRLLVRINALETGLAADDLSAVMPFAPSGIVLPKAAGGTDITKLSAILRVHEAENNMQDRATTIIAIATETAAATLNLASYRESSPRLEALTWGAEDLSADIGAGASRDVAGGLTGVFALARSLTLLGAAAADVTAIDTVFVDFRDDEGLRRECMEAERDGFTGKMAIHPSQVPVINACFTPSAEAVSQAERIVEAFAKSAHAGVTSMDGKMLDRPHLRRAERILARAAR